MHSFFRTIGFDKLSNEELEKVLDDVVENPTYVNTAIDSMGNKFVEFTKDYGDSIGISVCGTNSADGNFCMDYYYPYFRGTGITSEEGIEVEKHADREAYAAVCDDIKIGVTLIFYLINVSDYLTEKKLRNNFSSLSSAVTLSGLSKEGKIILPISKSERQIKNTEKMNQDRNHLIAAARDGDEDAIENLTLEDIDTYSMLSRRIVNEDILSIVDTYFMPYGIESDQYSVMGEILNFYYTKNRITGQKICILTIDTNDLIYDICINEIDLFGEPQVGRRFKGIIWLQGIAQFMN